MENDFLGRGWKFPVQVDPKTGRIMMSEYDEDISEAILIILQTSLGERVMRPKFGCGANKFIFDVVNTTTLTLIENDIAAAINTWEPRVGNVSVRASADRSEMGRLLIDIQYVVRATNSAHNLVYPFYLNEGTR